MALAGTLEIQMLANMARLQEDMRVAQNVVGGAMKNVESAVASAKAALGALGVSLGVGYFVSLVKGSIDAMDHLNDLSKSTGLAVESLAGLKLAAKQSGGDLDGIAASINKLSVNMGKDAEKFAKLGVTAKDPLEAFKQLSDIFVAIKDPQLRAAVGAEALGKSWAGAAPLLAEGSAKIAEMIEKGARLSGVTKEQAEKADELNDKWQELVGTGGAVNSIVGKMLDPLLKLTNQMIAAKEASSGLFGTMGRFFSIDGADADNPGKALEEINAKLQSLHKTKETFEGMGLLKQIFSADDFAIVKAQIAYLEMKKETLQGLMGAPFPKVGSADGTPAAAAAKAAAFLAGDKSAEDTDAAYRGLLKTLKEKLLVDAEQKEVSKLQLALDAMSAKNLATITPAREKELKDLAREVDLRKQRNAQIENDVKNEDALQKIRAEGAALESDADAKRIAAYDANQKTIEQIQFETSLIGLSNDARETAIALRAMELAGIKQGDSAYAGEAQRLREALSYRQAAQAAEEVRKQEAEGWKSLWSTVESTGKNVWTIMTAGGVGMAKSVGTAIKSSIYDMLYQLTARKWLINIGTSIAGSLGMSTAAGAADSMGGLFSAASGANTVSGWFGGPSIGAGSLGMGSLFSSGASTSAVAGFDIALGGAGGSAGASSLAAGGLEAGGALAGLGTAMPYIGAALLAYSLLSDGGGPKNSTTWLQGGPGSYNVGINNAAGGDPDMAQVRALNALLQDTSKYDQTLLAQYVGQTIDAGGPADTATLIGKLAALVQPAAAAAEATAQTQKEAAQKQLDAAQKQVELAQRDEQLTAQLTTSVRGLADQLGIGTLKSALGALGVSEYLSPMDRLAGARSQFSATLAGARGGDLAAVGALPDAVQTLLGIGRDVYASGSGFQDLFREANLALGEVLAKQQGLQDDILKDVPVTIMEASKDQIAELRRGFASMTTELSGVRDELRQLRAAA